MPEKRESAAVRLMAVEMISGLLAAADPREVARKLAEELRELTGARTVMLFAQRSEPAGLELLHCSPERRSALLSAQEVALLCPERNPGPMPLTTAEMEAGHPVRAALLRAGVDTLICFPLVAGGERVGLMLLLDPLDWGRIQEAAEIITLLSPPTALALRNALDLEQIERQRGEIARHALDLERRVQERTAEVAQANNDLAASRLAALNMMEDALEARDRAEQANAALRREMVERKEAEAALRESEERFRSLVEQAGDGFELTDEGGRFLNVNSETCRQLGYSKEELLRLTVPDVDPLVSLKQYQEVFRSLVDAGPTTFETVHRRKDGTEFPVEVRASVVELKGCPRGLSLTRDITQRKRAEEEQETLQTQLSQAQKMEAIGRLAGGVAHDFNNILTVILGHAGMALTRAECTPAIRADLLAVEQAAERSADLTRQLLAFARKQAVAPRLLDLNDTVAGMLKMLRRLIGEDIDLVWVPGSDLWPVKIDPSQLDQLMANLCINARDAIPGEGKVTIRTQNVVLEEDYSATHGEFLPGAYVMLVVSDDGCGMEKAVLQNIFEPFYTTKGPGVGTGLGLATVYGIVKQNGGFINVYSEPGEGTTFKIYLNRSAGRAVEKEAAGEAEPPRGRGETVLLVEDDKTILAMGRTILEKLGYTVLAAGTPGEAIRQLEGHAGQVDLLITDVVMPEMNGRVLSERLGEIRPGLRTLYVSGYTADVIAHHGVLDEGIQFLDKPFSMPALAKKIREVLHPG